MKITKTAKLPLELCRGSVVQRQKNMDTMSDAFFTEILDCFEGRKDVPFKDIFACMRKIIPTKIFLQQMTKQPVHAAITEGYNKKGNIVGYLLHLPIVKFSTRKNVVDYKEIGTICHEGNHLFYYLNNPKLMARKLIMRQKGCDLHDIQDFYTATIYTDRRTNMSAFAKNLKEFLHTKPPGEQIDCLQYWRYQIQTENIAYKREMQDFKKLKKINRDLYDMQEMPMKPSEFRFNMKQKIIEKMLGKTIQKERNSVV